MGCEISSIAPIAMLITCSLPSHGPGFRGIKRLSVEVEVEVEVGTQTHNAWIASGKSVVLLTFPPRAGLGSEETGRRESLAGNTVTGQPEDRPAGFIKRLDWE
jgi:hypothetical protein